MIKWKENVLYWVFFVLKFRFIDSVGNGIGRRVNCGCGYLYVGDGRIFGYWVFFSVGIGMVFIIVVKEKKISYI